MSRIDRRRAVVDAVTLAVVAVSTLVTAAVFVSPRAGPYYLVWALAWVGLPQLVQAAVMQLVPTSLGRSAARRAGLMVLTWAMVAFIVGAVVPFVEAAPSWPLGLTASGVCVVSLSVLRPLAATVVPPAATP